MYLVTAVEVTDCGIYVDYKEFKLGAGLKMDEGPDTFTLSLENAPDKVENNVANNTILQDINGFVTLF